MHEQITTSYMALQIDRASLDRRATRGWQAVEAAAQSGVRPKLQFALMGILSILFALAI